MIMTCMQVAGSLLCFFVVNVPMESAARLMDVAFFAGTDTCVFFGLCKLGTLLICADLHTQQFNVFRYLATLCAVLRLSSDALMEQTNIVSFSS